MSSEERTLPGPFGEAQRRAVEMAEELVTALEKSGDAKLLREARKTLRDLRDPKPPRKVRKSPEVLRHQASRIRLDVATADATGELNAKGNTP